MGREWKRTKIWNKSDKDWKELFDGDEIMIPAGGFIEMSRHDATRFVGQWVDPVDKGTKQIVHEKKLVREPVFIDTDDAFSGLDKNQCVICRKRCGSRLMLEKHIRSAHPGAIPGGELKKDDTDTTDNAGEEQI